MRVAFLTNQYPKVSHTFIRREINGLEAAGLHVERYSVRRTSEHLVDEADRRENECTRAILSSGIAGLVPAFLWTGIRHPFRLLRTLVRAWRMGWGSDRGPLAHLVYVAEACVLMAWAKKDRIDHVHVHFGTNPTAVALLAHWLGGPSYSFVAHGPEEFDKPESLGMETKIKEAKFVVAISSYGRSQLFRWCDESQWPKIKVIRMGVDGDFLDDPPQLPMPDGGKLVCVGRLCPQKGQVLLVDAFTKVLALGHDAELVLVGDGESRPQVERRIHECGIEQQVRITGWADADTVRKEILAARALVLPSFAEGLPVVIMEALALGRPVVTTFVAGIPELVSEDCGWLIPSGSTDAIVDAMVKVLTATTAELERKGAEGRRRVQKAHDCRLNAKALAELLTGLAP